MSQNRPTELPEKGVVAARRSQTFEMDERKSMAIITVGVTTVVINTICNMASLVFDEGSRARDHQQQPGVGWSREETRHNSSSHRICDQ